MPTTASAELSVTAEHVARYRDRVAAVARGLSADGTHEDSVAALFEAERSLRTAVRAIERALKLLGS